MAVNSRWECDGCGEVKITADNGKPPTDWARVHVAVEGFVQSLDRLANEDEYDLCWSCQKRLGDQLNPKHWPRRIAEAVAC